MNLLLGMLIIGIPALIFLIKGIIRKKRPLIIICAVVLLILVAVGITSPAEMKAGSDFLFSQPAAMMAVVVVVGGVSVFIARLF